MKMSWLCLALKLSHAASYDIENSLRDASSSWARRYTLALQHAEWELKIDVAVIKFKLQSRESKGFLLDQLHLSQNSLSFHTCMILTEAC